MKNSRSHVLSLLLLVLALGCQQKVDGPFRVRLYGQVTLNGKSLETGTVHLIPLDGDRAKMSGAEIVNGSYDVSNKGGVIPGEYRVEFTAMKSIPPYIGGDGSEVTVEQYLPPKFNEKSEFTLSVEGKSRSMKHHFELKD
ncbi:MAG TPA: hypothetical protein VNQ76_22795 [Planctomicrobium sp.]|nr:hypothetical protein [Planctomicrobium sp.]